MAGLRLADFRNLTLAEAKLVKHLKDRKRRICEIGPDVPPCSPPDDRIIRATLIRYLALGGCDACRLPETGLRVQGALIAGDDDKSTSTKGIDLYGCELNAEFHLKSCRIPDKVCLEMVRGISFDFGGSFLCAGLDARGLKATGGMQVSKCRVRGTLSLLGASLAGSFDANGTDFSEYVKRHQADIDGVLRSIDCRGLSVGGGFRLMRSKVAEALDLTGAKITGNLNLLRSAGGINTDLFGVTEESGATQFLVANRITVSGDVSFLDCRGPASTCSYSRIEGDLHLGFQSCDGDVYFSKLNLQGTVIRQCLKYKAKQKPKSEIDLRNLSVARLEDDVALWPDGLFLKLNGIRIGTFDGNADAESRKNWLMNRGDEFFPQPWEETAKVLREMGHGAEATKILIEKEREQRKARRERIAQDLAISRRDWGKSLVHDSPRPNPNQEIGRLLHLRLHLALLSVWDCSIGFFVGYGRKPFDAVWRGLLPMLIIGFLVFANAAGHGAIKPNLPQIQLNPAWVSCAEDSRGQLDCFLDHPDAASYPRFNALIYSADTLIPVVSLEMQSYWIPDDRSDRGMIARCYLWVHIFMGWLFTLLAVAGFSGLIKTDNTK